VTYLEQLCGTFVRIGIVEHNVAVVCGNAQFAICICVIICI